jgi:TRAP-type mannitol/chloroaromatic compound transport system permease large subunit
MKPGAAPAVPREELAAGTTRAMRLRRLLHALAPPIVLIIAVLGSILAGIASPTEASAVGAVGALLLGALRVEERRPWPIYLAGGALVGMLILSGVFDLRAERSETGAGDQAALYVAGVLGLGLVYGIGVGIVRTARLGMLRAICTETMRISAMVFTILIGAAMFSLVFRGFGGDDIVHEFLTTLPGGTIAAMFVVMLVMFLLGFFIDFIEICFVVVPIVAPILLQLDISPIWLGIMMAVNLQTSFLTPPFGFALFYLRGVAPPSVTTGQIYRGVVPFIILQLIGLAITGLWPQLSTALPTLLFR